MNEGVQCRSCGLNLSVRVCADCAVAAVSLMPPRGKGTRRRTAPAAAAAAEHDAGDEKTTAASAAVDADGDVSMESGGGGGGGGGGGTGSPAAKRPKHSPKRLTYPSSSAALSAMLDAVPGHRPGFLLPEINAIIGEYAAPEPLRWEAVPPPSSESKAAAVPTATITADGLTAVFGDAEQRVQTSLTLSECIHLSLRVALTIRLASDLCIERTAAEADEGSGLIATVIGRRDPCPWMMWVSRLDGFTVTWQTQPTALLIFSGRFTAPELMPIMSAAERRPFGIPRSERIPLFSAIWPDDRLILTVCNATVTLCAEAVME
jgi:hypothetical protein